MAERPYLYYDLTVSLCNECMRRVDAKVIIEDDRVYLRKYCPQHKWQKVLISTDADYYKRCRDFNKPTQMPLRYNTPVRWGCPYDCGLCADHEQHSCLALIDITDHCNLRCPICYSDSGPHRPVHKSLEQIESMLDTLVANEGTPDVVQISGGEPTIHPDFWAILDAARARPIKHLMINTNGVRIAEEPSFAERLAEYRTGFEVYLQFDSFAEGALRELRGKDLRSVRQRAIERLNDHRISTTLVVTVKNGVNDEEIGPIIDFAVKQPCIRGVTFQPVQSAGRYENFDPALHRLTLSDVRRKIYEQTTLFSADDLIPVPCHADGLCMGYAIKLENETIPLTRWVDPQTLLTGSGNDILFERKPDLHQKIGELFSASCSPDASAQKLGQLLCCLPQVPTHSTLTYENVFRVLIIQFLDVHNFDVRSVKKSCIHFVQPDGKIIPFDTYNLFYRDGKIDQLRRDFGYEGALVEIE